MALTDLTRISTSGIATGSTIDAPILRKDVSFRGSQVGVTSVLFDSSDDALEFNDDVKLKFGNTDGLEIYHSQNLAGTNDSYIDSSARNLYIRLNTGTDNGGNIALQAKKDEHGVLIEDDGSVKLYFDGNPKFETTSTGAVVTGILTATSFSGGGGISAGVVTCTGLDLNGNGDVSGNFVIGGDLTVNGTTTTLDTNLTEVDRIEVGANSNTIAGIAVTQSGSADIVRLYDGASQVVTVDDEGNVGVGINSPSTKLQVHGGLIKISGHANARVTVNDGANEAFFGFDNQGPLLIGNANADAQIRVQGTNDIFFQTGNTVKRLTIKGDTGKIGINSTSPQNSLDVVGGYQALGLYRNDFTGNSGAGIELYFGRAKANGDLFNCATVSAVGSDNTAQNGQLRFSVLNSGTMDEKLRIDNNGKLTLSNSEGIQLSAKNSNLYLVDGAISYYGTTNAVYVNGAGVAGWLRLNAAGSTNNRTAINIYGHNYSTGDTIDFRTNSLERLRIDSSGRVLIGGGSSPSQVGDGRLIVYADTRLHPAIKADCIDGGSNRANGFTLLADNYQADESICNFGISYSSAGLVLSRGVKVSNAADDTYLSSMDSFALRPCAIKLDELGAFNFLTTETSATRTTDSAVSLTEVFKIDRVGNVYQKISGRNMYLGASGQLRIGVQSNGDPNIEAVAGNLKIMDSGNTIMQLRDDGFEMKQDIYFSTAGKGIVLGNTSNVDANTLDDYEEGTWTPAPTAGSFTSATGRYTKVGRIVVATFAVQVNTDHGANFFQFNGLPFDNVASNAGENLCSIGFTDSGLNGNIVGAVYTGTALIFSNFSGTNYRYNTSGVSGKIFRGGVTYMSSV